MKTAAFERHHDGHLDMSPPVHNERVTFDIFKKVHGGRLATNEEISQARVRYIAPGYSVWKAARGQLMAVRDE